MVWWAQWKQCSTCMAAIWSVYVCVVVWAFERREAFGVFLRSERGLALRCVRVVSVRSLGGLSKETTTASSNCLLRSRGEKAVRQEENNGGRDFRGNVHRKNTERTRLVARRGLLGFDCRRELF
jgi:hypothetical protein